MISEKLSIEFRSAPCMGRLFRLRGCFGLALEQADLVWAGCFGLAPKTSKPLGCWLMLRKTLWQ